MNVLRRVQGVSRMERIRSEHIRQHLGQESVLDVIRRKQENWKGKLNEMSNDRVTKGCPPLRHPVMIWGMVNKVAQLQLLSPSHPVLPTSVC